MRFNTVSTLLLVLVCAIAVEAQKAQDIYQQALVQERAVGNLGTAIELFQQAAREAGTDREFAARALLAAARCYEKLGQANAILLYEQVAQSYADQSAHAVAARERLTALQRATEVRPRPSDPRASDLEVLRTQVFDFVKTLEQRATMLVEPQHPDYIRLRSQLQELTFRLEAERLRQETRPGVVTELRNRFQAQVQGWEQIATFSLFDPNSPVTFSGKVIKLEWVNPSVWIHVEATEPNGTTVVHPVKGCSPSALLQGGWRRDSLKVGEVVTVEGIAARDGSPAVSVATFTTADGRKLFAGWGTAPCIPPK